MIIKWIFIGMILGMILGATLELWLIRKIGKKSQFSRVWAMVFHRITEYRAMVFEIERTPCNIIVKVYGDDDNKNLKDALKQMGFSSDRITETIGHVIKNAPDKPLEEKLREALKYLDSENNYKNVTKEA